MTRPINTQTVIQNMKRMLSDRGWMMESEETNTIDYVPNESNEESISGAIKIVATAWAPTTQGLPNHVCCIMHERDKEIKKSFGIDSIRKYLPFLKGRGFQQAIFLVDAKVTPQARQATAQSSILCEFFLFESLTHIVVDHRKMAHSRRLTPEEEIELKKVIDPTKLPKILLHKDPVAKYYGYRPGYIIVSKRGSEENGTAVTFRIVI